MLRGVAWPGALLSRMWRPQHQHFAPYIIPHQFLPVPQVQLNVHPTHFGTPPLPRQIPLPCGTPPLLHSSHSQALFASSPARDKGFSEGLERAAKRVCRNRESLGSEVGSQQSTSNEASEESDDQATMSNSNDSESGSDAPAAQYRKASAFKKVRKRSRSKRIRQTSTSSNSLECKLPKNSSVGRDDILSDPAVIALGPASMPRLAPGVSGFLGNRFAALNQYRSMSTQQTTSQVEERSPSPPKTPTNIHAPPHNGRQWTAVGGKSFKGRQYMHFSIASYNVLAQNLIQANPYLYEGSAREHLRWEYRREGLLAEIAHHRPDILCLQEVQREHFNDFFLPRLKSLGYDGLYKCRTGDKKDGCASFYKTAKFHLDGYKRVEYFRRDVRFLDRDNVGLLLRLAPRKASSTGARLVVANTHLLFNPRRGDIKLAQLQLLLAETERLAYTAPGRYQPVLLCGDMNAEPHSDLYAFLTREELHFEGLRVRDIGGQAKQARGPAYYLGKELLPRQTGITDTCQYEEALLERMELVSSSGGEEEEEGECMSEEEGTSRARSPSKKKKERSGLIFGSGHLSHPLSLRSVYRHQRYRQVDEVGSRVRLDPDDWEASTFHGLANCNVDYIFYSSPGQRGKDKEAGKLHLTGKLQMLTSGEMQERGPLPNQDVSSDHIILMAKFAALIN